MTSPSDTLSIADRALLSARLAWPNEADDPGFWGVFSPAWGESLRRGWESAPRLAPDEARDRLRREHEAEAHPDLGRVHPTWWLRALREETPAVRRSVAAHAPEGVRATLLEGLGLSADDLRADRAPDPDALRGALALWAERLVGDLAERADDPPIIRALSRDGDPRAVAGLARALALAKWALAGEEPPGAGELDRTRLIHFGATFGDPGPGVRERAGDDLARYSRSSGDGWEVLGLLTMARLLRREEPYRVRWALQHLPYPVAKITRALMQADASGRDPSSDEVEARILRMAEERLRDEASGNLPGGGAP